MIEWLEQWYKNECDGDWEHQYGVLIETLDNPGWSVEIDLSYTKLENLEIKYTLEKESEDDWMGFSIEKKMFMGMGSTNKLNAIIKKFKDIWDSN